MYSYGSPSGHIRKTVPQLRFDKRAGAPGWTALITPYEVHLHFDIGKIAIILRYGKNIFVGFDFDITFSFKAVLVLVDRTIQAAGG
jgi:hypothetical protein